MKKKMKSKKIEIPTLPVETLESGKIYKNNKGALVCIKRIDNNERKMLLCEIADNSHFYLDFDRVFMVQKLR